MRSPGFLVLVSAIALICAGCTSSSSPDSGAGFTPTNLTPPRANFTQVDLVVGTGATANTGNRITVGYSGFLYDPAQPDNKGRLFDSNTAFTFTLGVGQVIKGWDQGRAKT